MHQCQLTKAEKKGCRYFWYWKSTTVQWVIKKHQQINKFIWKTMIKTKDKKAVHKLLLGWRSENKKGFKVVFWRKTQKGLVLHNVLKWSTVLVQVVKTRAYCLLKGSRNFCLNIQRPKSSAHHIMSYRKNCWTTWFLHSHTKTKTNLVVHPSKKVR